ncbi:glycosyltransferase family 4 protein [Capillibacterium thermochitinicola]|uniref:glycosyltransferase family 4 protein n=1 Tax=Capillibacterium thermochitinicola TaxID=2699427 RepID=UPI002F2B4396
MNGLNILHLTTFLQGGAGRILTDLALAQKSRNNEVYVLSSKTSEPGYCSYEEYINKLQDNNIPLYEEDSSFKRDLGLNLHFASKVREIIKNCNIDLIHAHASVPALTGLIARSGLKKYIPVIQTMHGWGTNKKPEHEKMDITIMNGLDQVVTVSKSDKELLIEKGVQKEKIKVIYNGITLEQNDEVDPVVAAELLEYKKRGYRIIGCIGTLCERKNQQLLLDAIKLLGKDYNLFCAFIGEGDLLPKMQKQIEQENLQKNVRLYGYKPMASNYIKYFDVFVLPSTSEGFGLTIVEAFKEKTLVIASDIKVFQELITDGREGFLFRNNILDSLIETLKKVLCLSRSKIEEVIENGFARYQKEFTLNRMIMNYEDLYTIIVSQD